MLILIIRTYEGKEQLSNKSLANEKHQPEDVLPAPTSPPPPPGPYSLHELKWIYYNQL